MRCSYLLAFWLFVPSLTIAEEALPSTDRLPSRPEPPDPLVLLDGTPVRTAEEWNEKRRPELMRLFQHYEYGFLPPFEKIEARVTKTVPDLLDGKATLKEIEIRFPWLRCDQAPVLHLALFLPNNRKGPRPVFLALNACGNQEVLPDERITATESWQDDNCKKGGRGKSAEYWCVDEILSRGYGLATFHQSDIDPDKHDFTDGLHACLTDGDVPERSRPGTIAAWAWGLHRAVDYLVTDPDVDAKRVCVTGHSRRGKTALFAGAMDERIALVVPHQSGTGGMAMSRNNDQETVERINRVFPHWFDDEFTNFNGREDRLPVDQHLLVALVAPRPLLDTEGSKDIWANFDSSLRTLKAADPVYKLLGKQGLVGDGMLDGVPITAQNAGDLLQYRLDAEHTLNREYWWAILDFADLKLGKAK